MFTRTLNVDGFAGNWTLQILMELDKLVQLIESPVFAPLRMRLLSPAEVCRTASYVLALLLT